MIRTLVAPSVFAGTSHSSGCGTRNFVPKVTDPRIRKLLIRRPDLVLAFHLAAFLRILRYPLQWAAVPVDRPAKRDHTRGGSGSCDGECCDLAEQ